MKTYSLKQKDGIPYLYEESDDMLETIFSEPSDIYSAMKCAGLIDRPEEYLYLFALDTKLVVKAMFEIAHGGIDNCFFDEISIFMRALLAGSKRIILAHNHPTDSLSYSSDDVRTTKELKDGCKLLGITLLDHIVVNRLGYISMGSEGVFDDEQDS